MTEPSMLDVLHGLLPGNTPSHESFQSYRIGAAIPIQVQAQRDYWSAADLQQIELQNGPVGFPLVYPDDAGQGLLAWCAKHGVWGSKLQAECLVAYIQGIKKLQKNQAKRILKDWTPLATGEAGDEPSLLTYIMLHPTKRMELQDGMTMAKGWLIGPVGNILRAAHRWAGLTDPTTLDTFIKQHADWVPPETEPEKYWPTELWPLEVAEENRPLVKALVNFLHRTLILARKWDTLDERKRNGVLLAAYGVASMLGTSSVLMPFAAVHPELRERLSIQNLTYEGLCDDKGRPTSLLGHTLSLAKLVYGGGNPPGELALQLVSPVSRELDNLLLNADQVRADLREYRTLYLKTAHVRVTEYVSAIKAQYETLPEACQSIVLKAEDSLVEWAHRTRIEPLDDVSGGTEPTPVEIDYWQKNYLAMADKLPRGVHFKDWLNEHLSEATGESLDSLQARASEAVARMDTALLTELVARIEAQKAAASTAVVTYLGPVIITPELRDCAPQPVTLELSDLATGQEVSALRARVKELEAEVEQGAELLELHDENETQLKADLESMRADLHKEQQRNESLSHQLVGKQLSVAAEKAGLSDAIIRAMSETATLKDALDSLPALLPDTVVVLATAYAGIEGCGYKNVRKVLDNLMRLCGPYYDAIVRQGTPDTQARGILGTKYKANESQTTLSIHKLRTQREFRYEGKSELFEQHLTLGVKRGDQSCIQIYFKIINGKMVIAYVGPHLDTSST